MLVDYDGRVLAQADPGPGEKIVVGPIDLAALRAEREQRRGHHMLSHLRTQAYRAYQNPIYPGSLPPGAKTLRMREFAPLARPADEIRRSLEDPVGTLPLAKIIEA